MTELSPFWSSAKANLAELDRLREIQAQLQMQDIHPDLAAASFSLLTAKLSAKGAHRAQGKLPPPRLRRRDRSPRRAGQRTRRAAHRQGRRPTLADLEDAPRRQPRGRALGRFLDQESRPARPLQELLHRVAPRSPGRGFLTPSCRRCASSPAFPATTTSSNSSSLSSWTESFPTPEEMKAFLEPHSPPAPPPPVNMRRARASKKDAKAAKGRGKKAARVDPDDEDDADSEECCR